MNPGRFFMPNYIGNIGMPISNSMMPQMASLAGTVTRGTGLFSKLTNSVRSINWGGFLNNANKTLNFVNQAIPLVRQAGPMVNNMKSMLRIAKAFGSETTSNNTNNINITTKNENNNSLESGNSYTKEADNSNSSLNFFV